MESREILQLENKVKNLQKRMLLKLRYENQMKDYREDPGKWLVDRMGMPLRTIKWDDYAGYEEHKWDGTPNPLLYAWESLAEGFNVGVESATSTGKTYFLALVVMWFLDTFENPLVVTCAPKRDQLKLLLWSEVSRKYEKFNKIRPNSVLNTLTLKKDITHPIYNASAEAVGFVAGVGADEESATKAQGFHRENMLIIVEGAPGVNDAIMKAFENTSTGSRNFILAVGNPDNQLDALHTFCESPGVKAIRISAYDHPNYVLKREVIPGAVTTKSVAIRTEKYGADSQFFRSRIRGISPTEGEDGLFRMTWLEGAYDDTIEPVSDNSFNALGVDVANSEMGDKAALAAGHSNILDYLVEFQCPNANHLAYNIFMSDAELEKAGYQNYHTIKMQDLGLWDFNIGVDSVGVGAATVNTFYDNGYKIAALQGRQLDEAITLDNEGKPLYTFNNRRSQMFWELREDLRQGNIYIRLQPKIYRALCRELLIHTYTTKAGKIVVVSKDDIKKKLGKSPNLADCVAYWNHVRRGHYQTAIGGGVYA